MADLQAMILANHKKFMDAYNANDMDALSKLYTEDCKLMPTGFDTMVGHEGVKGVFGTVQAAGGVSVKLTLDEVGVLSSDEMIYERAQYEFTKEDGTSFDKGKYVVIWKKVGGQYLLHIDIFNSSNPTAVQPDYPKQ